MPTVHFLGKVVPSSHYSTTMWGLPKVHYKSGDGIIEADITITVKGSEIDVECVMDSYKKENLTYLHKIAYDAARAAINVMVFATGITLSVIFDRVLDEDGKMTGFIIQHPDLGKLCTAYSLESSETGPGVGDILSVILTEPALFLALDDLITATTLHHLVTINSARAIEGIRHAMAPSGLSRDKEWELFRNNLNLDKAYISLITDHSVSGRHGHGTFVPGTITSVIVERAWTIMNRFLEFRKGGNKALKPTDFPFLQG